MSTNAPIKEPLIVPAYNPAPDQKPLWVFAIVVFAVAIAVAIAL